MDTRGHQDSNMDYIMLLNDMDMELGSYTLLYWNTYIYTHMLAVTM